MGLLGALLIRMMGYDLDSFCDEVDRGMWDCDGVAKGLLSCETSQKNHLHLLFAH